MKTGRLVLVMILTALVVSVATNLILRPAGGGTAAGGSLWTEIQNRGVLKVGVATCEPHCIKDPQTGEWSGVALEIMSKLAETLGVKLEPVDTTWDYIVAGLQAGKWDIAASLNATPPRTLAVDFSDPFYFYQVSLVYKAGNPKIPANPVSVTDFDKKDVKLAVMSGTAQDRSLTRVIKNAEIVRLSTVDETRMAVISGRADAVVDDDATNHLFAQTYPWARTCIPDPPISREGICFGFAKGHYADIQTLNVLIQMLRDTGQLREWEIQYGTILK